VNFLEKNTLYILFFKYSWAKEKVFTHPRQSGVRSLNERFTRSKSWMGNRIVVRIDEGLESIQEAGCFAGLKFEAVWTGIFEG